MTADQIYEDLKLADRMTPGRTPWQTLRRRADEIYAAKPKDISEMYCVSWEHEYYTDDDAASFDTLAEAQAFETKLRELGKRRIRIDGPGITTDDDF
jgi:hypothetical protein